MNVSRLLATLFNLPQPQERAAWILRSGIKRGAVCLSRSKDETLVLLIWSNPILLGEYMGAFGMSREEWIPTRMSLKEFHDFSQTLQSEGVAGVRMDPPTNPFETFEYWKSENLAEYMRERLAANR